MKQNLTLGYHTIGEYHYFCAFQAGSRLLGTGPNDKFKTHEEFAGLVTGVHEHYHLMQELQHGFCWWRQDTRETLAALAVEGIGRISGSTNIPLCSTPDPKQLLFEVDFEDPLSLAPKFFAEIRTIDRNLNLVEFTHYLLDKEMQDSPEYARLIGEDAYNLTTIDLMECHAAALTELYISRLLAESPEKFDSRVVSDMAPLFRLSAMLPTYRKPLNAMVFLFKALGLNLKMAGANVHSMYKSIPEGVHYFLLTFFLDFALHLPPEPLGLLDKVPDTSTQQDIYPPFRFLNLALLWALGVGANKAGLASTLTREGKDYSDVGEYYSDVSPILARGINDMHSRVRDSDIPKTFFSISDTTEKWFAHREKSPLGGVFPEIDKVEASALELKKSHPDHWFRLQPAGFEQHVGVPRIFITPNGLGTLPYVVDRTGSLARKSQSELMEYMKKAATLHYNGFGTGEWTDDPDVPVTLVPFRFIEQAMSREMVCRTSEFLLFAETIRCPLTESLGRFVPCKARTRSCECIRDLSTIPRTMCLLRETVDRHFGAADRFS